MENPHGILVVDKDAGMTSHDVVGVVRKLFRTKRVGHTGTLDPDATGVLVLCLGNGTRLAEYLSASQKHYVTEVAFGIETTTQDASGEIVAEKDGSSLTREFIEGLLPQFRGRILQIPPMVSALHHKGKRLYELARQGITVAREARPIHISQLELTGFVPGVHPTATLEITCSTGTYIRALASDLGETAGTGAMMATLRRTWVGKSVGKESARVNRVGFNEIGFNEIGSNEVGEVDGEPGSFSLEYAHTLAELRERAEKGTLADTLLPLISAVSAWPQAVLNQEQTVWIRHGRPLALDSLSPDLCRNGLFFLASGDNTVEPYVDLDSDEPEQEGNRGGNTTGATPIALVDASVESIIAVAHLHDRVLHPVKVFA